jgi:hypothetical protein
VGLVAAVPPQIPGLVGWRPLARGGFATVWEAKQLSLNRLVAVKVDRRTLESDSEQRRFLREAGAAGRMSGHPGIVTVHDAGILTDDRPYLVMALCEGGSLTKWVKGEPRPSQEEVREVGVRIADALAATHARGVLHRDVKPANILIDSYGHAGLADFGLAALPDPGMELSETLEAITPAYAPPEVFHRRPPTEAGDVYSLGATLYAVLCGRPPRWPETGTPNVVDMFERLDDPIDRIPGVDDEFMDTLLVALSSDPADRPSAAQFRDRLNALTLGAPTADGQPAAVMNGVATRPAVDQPANDQPVAADATDRPQGGATAVAGEPPLDTEFDPALPPAAAPPGDRPPPEQLADDPGDDRRRSRSRTGLLVALVAVFLGVALVAALANLLPGRESVAPGGNPVTSVPATSVTSPSPEPTPQPTPSAEPSEERGALPAGAVACPDLGADVYCMLTPECWGGVQRYVGLRTAEQADCYEDHLYQTYAVGMLDFVPRTQESLDKVREVRQACDPDVPNQLLVDQADRRDDWVVYSLPPLEDDEYFFRCIFGRSVRNTPFELKPYER